MSRRTLRLGLLGTLALVALSVAVAAAIAGASAGARAPERELTLIARDMGFFLPGDQRANPTLHMAPGERVEVRLVNGEPGIRHDLLVEEMGFEIPAFRDGGERVAVLQAPAAPGRYEYVCSLHRGMMRGVIMVGGSSDERARR
jgi:plastocyanin